MCRKHLLLLAVFAHVSVNTSSGQPSVAQEWNETLLNAVRNDYARPTIHARNLFHTSAAMYDAWAAFDETADTYLLGKIVGGFECSFTGMAPPEDIQAAREEAISYAAYRVLIQRFQGSPGADESVPIFDSLMDAYGFDPAITTTDYSTGSPAALGNHIGACLIEFGLQDGANEEGEYANLFYSHVNEPLDPVAPGNPLLTDPNRWQPLTLGTFIDQGGNVLPVSTPEFLSPEWGRLVPFAMTEDDVSIYERDGFEYQVYHDPGPPPLLDTTAVGGLSEEFKWSFALVPVWQSHHDPNDGILWDISPGSIGNIQELPRTFEEHRDFYNLLEGGDIGEGHPVNPYTGESYEPQMVPRGDYTRALSEFWADGPDTETPPGHWFTILNYVSNHPSFERRLRGEGPVLDELEWDVKAYFTLGGALHDAAISAWSIKGWYDYIRPVSAVRWMADRGQSSDPELPRYHPAGLPLIDGYIELVGEDDPLAGEDGEHVDKVKLYTWRGHDWIDDPANSMAGSGWILAEYWWPYQLPTFVTPPFAGYVSGHSTYSRAAAEVMTLLTGDEYFPGGMGEFHMEAGDFLVFENGPSVNLTLQWATYRDASDQCSLSRIWGGIHPPVDDIPGRIIGEKVGVNAFHYAKQYFSRDVTNADDTSREIATDWSLEQNYPNPFNPTTNIAFNLKSASFVTLSIFDPLGREVASLASEELTEGRHERRWNAEGMASGVYYYRLEAHPVADGRTYIDTRQLVVIK